MQRDLTVRDGGCIAMFEKKPPQGGFSFKPDDRGLGVSDSTDGSRGCVDITTVRALRHDFLLMRRLSKRASAKGREDEKKPEHSNVHYIKCGKRLVSRTRLVMGLLLIVAIPIFISLANKTVHENAEAIRQSFGR
jgi:hypothetical protein